MKFSLLNIAFWFCFTALSQNVQWVRLYNSMYNKIHFDSATIKITLAGYDNFRIIEKTGFQDTMYPLATSFVPYDLIKKNGNFYFAGTAPGLTAYRVSSNLATGQVAWDNIYTSQMPYNYPTTYYPQTRALSLFEHTNYLYIAGIYQDSIKLGGQWLYGGSSLISKVQPSTGNILWAKTIPGVNFIPRSYGIYKFSLAANIYTATTFGSFQLSPNTNRAFVIAKMDSNCVIKSAKLMGEGMQVSDMVMDKNKNMYMCGAFNTQCKIDSTPYPNNYGGLFIMKADSNANIQWSKLVYGSYFMWNNLLSKLHLSTENEVYATGWMASDTLNFQDTILYKSGQRNALLLKYSTSGKRLIAFNLKDSDDNIGTDITTDNEGNSYWLGALKGIASVGSFTINGPAGFLIKFAGSGTINSLMENNLNTKIKVFPNPNKGIFTVESPLHSKIIITNIFGVEVYRGIQKSNTTQLSQENLIPGIYFLTIKNDTETSTKKIIIQ